MKTNTFLILALCFVWLAYSDPALKLSQWQTAGGVNIIGGATNNDGFGSALARGDVNNDGIVDLIVGSFPGTTSDKGAVFVLYGQTTPFSSADTVAPTLSSASATTGYKVTGAAIASTPDTTGTTVVYVGDVNKDGFGDFVVSNTGYSSGKGAVYLVLGKSTANGVNIDLSSITAGTVITFSGATSAGIGNVVTALGDINADGYADFAIGDKTYSSNKGAVYVIYGQASFSNSAIDLTTVPTTTGTTGASGSGLAGFTLTDSATGEYFGTSVASADVNNDGIPDILVGTLSSIGKIYVVFGAKGSANAALDVATITGSSTAGFIIKGTASTAFGGLITSIDDVNNDGYPDIAISSTGSPTGRASAGIIHIIYGKATASWTAMSSLTLDTTATWVPANGFRIWGATASDNILYSAAGGIDINRDGIKDIVLGDYLAGGIVYAVYGRSTNAPGDIDLATLATSQGLGVTPTPTVQGYNIINDNNGAASATRGSATVTGDALGWALVTGDVDKDGFPELIISAPQRGHGSQTTPGVVYVVHFNCTVGAAAATNCLQCVSNVCQNCAPGTALTTAGLCTTPSPISIKTTQTANYAGSVLSVIGGANANEAFGYAVSARGDVNKDGINDLIITTYPYTTTGIKANVWVIYGQTSGFAADTAVASFGATAGYKITAIANSFDGTSTYDLTGARVTILGDVNGDKVNDFLVTNPTGKGIVYLIYGTSGTTAPTINLNSLGTSGISITGATGAGLGTAITSVGDINGDNYADFAVGDPTNNKVYVYYGSASLASVDYSGSGTAPSGTAGFTITNGNSGEGLGTTITAADVNNDGYQDIIMGTTSATGKVYVVFGLKANVALDVKTMTVPTQGVVINGVLSSSFGSVLRTVEDVNKDGYQDFVIGSKTDTTGRRNSGTLFVILGKATASWASIDTTVTWKYANGYRIYGAAINDNLGAAVVSNGLDANQDGVNDIAVSTINNNQGTGAVYIVYGQSGTPTSDVDLSAGPSAAQGFALVDDNNGAASSTKYSFPGDGFGYTLAAGDIDGDKKVDLIVSAPQRTRTLSGTASPVGQVNIYHLNSTQTTGCLQNYNNTCLACGTGYLLGSDGNCFVPPTSPPLAIVVYDNPTPGVVPITVASSSSSYTITKSSTTIAGVDQNGAVGAAFPAYLGTYTTGSTYTITFATGLPILSLYSLDASYTTDSITIILPTGGQNIRVENWNTGTIYTPNLYVTGGTYTFGSSDSCGSHYVDNANQLAYVLVTGDPLCDVVVRQVRSVGVVAQYNVNPSVFVANGLAASLRNQTCKALGLNITYCRISQLIQGSTFAYLVVDSVIQGTTATTADLLALQTAVQTAIQNSVSLTGATLLSVTVSQSVPVSNHPPASNTAPSDDSHRRTVILAAVLSTVLGTLFIVLVYVLISRYFKNRNASMNNPNVKVAPGR